MAKAPRHVGRTARRALMALAGGGARVDAAELAGLPATAQRYLTLALPPGISLPRVARVAMRGAIRLNGAWRRFRATEWLAPDLGFVWRATLRMGPLCVRGYDAYWAGAGVLRWRLLGILPVAMMDGPDVTRSARGRAAAEAVLQPAALLPSRGTVWRPGDADTSAVATVTTDGEAHDIEFAFTPEGYVRSVHMQRWGDPKGPGTPFQHAPFGGEMAEPRAFGGITIPTRLRIGWWFGTPRFAEGEFFRATIHDAAFA